MTARLCAGVLALALALTACSSRQPPHKWIAYEGEGGGAPVQRLTEAPRIVVDARPLSLLNFVALEDLDYDRKRVDAASRGASDGALLWISAGIPADCGRNAALCLGIVVVGAAAGAATGAIAGVARQGTWNVTGEQADRLAEAVTAAELSEKLGALAEQRIGSVPRLGDYPRVVLCVTAVLMVPTESGVTFRVAAEAQAFPAPGQEWQASQHYIQLPSRTAGEWLGADGEGRTLKRDLDSALKVLAFRIIPAYLPASEGRAD